MPVSLAAARAATHPAPPDERYHWQQEEDGGRCRRRRGGGGGGARWVPRRGGTRRTSASLPQPLFPQGSEGLLLTTLCWLLHRPPCPRCSRRRQRPEGRSPIGDRAAARDPTAIGVPRQRGGRERGLRHVTPLFTVPGPRPALPPRLRAATPQCCAAPPRGPGRQRSPALPRRSQPTGNWGP